MAERGQRFFSSRVEGTPSRDEGPSVGTPWVVQLKRDVAGLTYEEQTERLRAPLFRPSAVDLVQKSEKDTGSDTQPAEQPATAAAVKAGTFGMVTSDVTMKAKDGSQVELKAGEAVEVVSITDDRLTVKAWSGHNGVEGSISAKVFREQPRIGDKENKAEPEDYVYKQYTGDLFIGKKSTKTGKRYGKKAPRLEDVLQGSLGDCYLMASLCAVVAARPDIIQNMVTWDSGTGLFSVTFQELQDDGSFLPHVETVDGFLPSAFGAKYPKYAGNDGKTWDPKDMALWPAIIEKAYAQWKGGYKALEEDGGLAADVMTEITGAESESLDMPNDVTDVIPLFTKIQKDKRPCCVGTKNYMKQANKEGLFNGSDAGPYAATLTTGEGLPAELVKKKVSIKDKKGGAGSAKDDGKGALTGTKVKSGSVDYESGGVELSYETGKGPKQAEDLTATYSYHGVLSKALNIHGEHYYVFRQVRGNQLVLHNPWGPDASYQPKPMNAADFLQYFDTIDANTPVDPEVK